MESGREGGGRNEEEDGRERETVEGKSEEEDGERDSGGDE